MTLKQGKAYEKNPFPRLPLKILELITDRLSPDDVLTFCCTSRDLSNHIVTLLYRHITLNSDTQLQYLINALYLHTSSNAKSFCHVTKSLTFCYRNIAINLQSLDIITRACPSLTTLDFFQSSWIWTTSRLAERYLTGATAAQTTNTYSGLIPYSRIENDLIIPKDAKRQRDIQAVILNAVCSTILHNHPHLTCLKMDLSTVQFERSNSARLHNCLCLLPTGLTELTLRVMSWELTMDDVECIHDRCPRLEALDLDYGNLDESGVAIPGYPSLERNHVLKKLSLNIDGEKKYFWPWLWYVGKKYGPQLASVHFNSPNCCADRIPLTLEQMAIVDTCAFTFAQQHASTLRSLELTNMMIFDGFWNHMKSSCDQSLLANVRMKNRYIAEESKAITIGSANSHLVRLSMLDYVKTWLHKLDLSVAGDAVKMDDILCAIRQCSRLTDLRVLGAHPLFQFVPLPSILDQCPRLHTYTMEMQRLLDTELWPTQHGLVSLKLENVAFKASHLNRALAALHSLRDLIIMGSSVSVSCDYSTTAKRTPAPKLTFLNPGMSLTIADLGHEFCRNDYYLAVESRGTALSSFWVAGNDDDRVTRFGAYSPKKPSFGRRYDDPDPFYFPKQHLYFVLTLSQHYPFRYLKVNKSVLIRKGSQVSHGSATHPVSLN
ncbi:hypothetical protein DM01DRAFT_1381435 [Hesseltinella vesiculosa]|uniref:F-box domain-containing protein n=1 Tax=Hesseltinella vesiculosa TaxID=101127 RepID=A0A1X2GQ08_9FUNG|nr:hypothetical protein DM01DRAFT_1381435 [Hesseltinella vesiculosa]